VGDLSVCRRGRVLGFHFGRWLVCAKPLEGGLPEEAIGSPAGKLDLGYELRLSQTTPATFLGAPMPVKGDFFVSSPRNIGSKVLTLAAA
jgi:hypothetical protein